MNDITIHNQKEKKEMNIIMLMGVHKNAHRILIKIGKLLTVNSGLFFRLKDSYYQSKKNI